ncbi:MAG TPA: hypothetical protein VFP68_10750 [Burkholderiaceae bacterium]|nr:hypothetical protein [Burkholderiaceae bacterium]
MNEIDRQTLVTNLGAILLLLFLYELAAQFDDESEPRVRQGERSTCREQAASNPLNGTSTPNDGTAEQ